jgi:hypothetical protein
VAPPDTTLLVRGGPSYDGPRAGRDSRRPSVRMDSQSASRALSGADLHPDPSSACLASSSSSSAAFTTACRAAAASYSSTATTAARCFSAAFVIRSTPAVRVAAQARRAPRRTTAGRAGTRQRPGERVALLAALPDVAVEAAGGAGSEVDRTDLAALPGDERHLRVEVIDRQPAQLIDAAVSVAQEPDHGLVAAVGVLPDAHLHQCGRGGRRSVPGRARRLRWGRLHTEDGVAVEFLLR